MIVIVKINYFIPSGTFKHTSSGLGVIVIAVVYVGVILVGGVGNDGADRGVYGGVGIDLSVTLDLNIDFVTSTKTSSMIPKKPSIGWRRKLTLPLNENSINIGCTKVRGSYKTVVHSRESVPAHRLCALVFNVHVHRNGSINRHNLFNILPFIRKYKEHAFFFICTGPKEGFDIGFVQEFKFGIHFL